MIKPARSNRTTRAACLPDRQHARRHRPDESWRAKSCHSDGLRDQLPGAAIAVGDHLPQVRLAAPGGQVDLAVYASGWLLVWCFPGDDDELFSVDEVMGRSLEEHRLELAALNCVLIGVSSQEQDTLARLASRAKTTYPLLSDPQLALAQQMRLPTIQCGDECLYQRLVFIARAGRVAQVFYRVPPLACASRAAQWLSDQSHQEDDS